MGLFTGHQCPSTTFQYASPCYKIGGRRVPACCWIRKAAGEGTWGLSLLRAPDECARACMPIACPPAHARTHAQPIIRKRCQDSSGDAVVHAGVAAPPSASMQAPATRGPHACSHTHAHIPPHAGQACACAGLLQPALPHPRVSAPRGKSSLRSLPPQPPPSNPELMMNSMLGGFQSDSQTLNHSTPQQQALAT